MYGQYCAKREKEANAMEKLLPQGEEAERGMLGSIIIDPEAVDRVIGFVQADDFYRDAHRTVAASADPDQPGTERRFSDHLR